MVDNVSCFSLTVHQNYIGTDAEKNPFFLSVVLSDQNNQRVPQYHSILWRKTVRNKYLIAALTFFVCFFVLDMFIIHFFAFFRISVFIFINTENFKNISYFSFYTIRTYNSTIVDKTKRAL